MEALVDPLFPMKIGALYRITCGCCKMPEKEEEELKYFFPIKCAVVLSAMGIICNNENMEDDSGDGIENTLDFTEPFAFLSAKYIDDKFDKTYSKFICRLLQVTDNNILLGYCSFTIVNQIDKFDPKNLSTIWGMK